jgi:AcrR family transcriptional regulator
MVETDLSGRIGVPVPFEGSKNRNLYSVLSATTSSRTPRADAVRNRLRVLDAAQEAFADHGDEAQMDDVARRAGVGVGTLYRHFPTKSALAAAVLERQIDELERFVMEDCAPDPDPWAALVRIFHRAGANQANDRGLGEALMDMADEVPENCSHRRRLGPPTAAILARAQAAGVARPEITEDDLHGLFCGLSAVSRGGGDWERYLEIMLAGLRA